MVPELQRVQRAARQGAALQNLVLGLIVVVRHLVLFHRFFEGDDVRGFLFDQNLDARVEDRRGREGVDAGAREHHQEDRQRRPAPLVKHAQVIAEMDLGVFGRLRRTGMVRRRRLSLWVERHRRLGLDTEPLRRAARFIDQQVCHERAFRMRGLRKLGAEAELRPVTYRTDLRDCDVMAYRGGECSRCPTYTPA